MCKGLKEILNNDETNSRRLIKSEKRRKINIRRTYSSLLFFLPVSLLSNFSRVPVRQTSCQHTSFTFDLRNRASIYGKIFETIRNFYR